MVIKDYPNWRAICAYLNSDEVKGVNIKLCAGCGYARITDNQKKPYMITSTVPLDDVKKIVQRIQNEKKPAHEKSL